MPCCGICTAAIGVAMRSKGAVTLGDIVGRVRMLEIACRHCERHGWLSVARLVEEHGADLTLPYLRERLAGIAPGFSRHRSMSAVAPTSRSRRPRTNRRAPPSAAP